MFDYMSVILPLRHDTFIEASSWRLISRDGSLLARTGVAEAVRSEYGHLLRVSTAKKGEPLSGIHITGNPAKFLQGHNAFGSDDLCALVTEVAKIVLEQLNLSPSVADLDRWASGDFEVTQLDIAGHYDLGSIKAADAAVRHIGRNAWLPRHGEASTEPNTVYFGKHSRRWSLKFYVKRVELDAQGHELPPNLPMREEVLAECTGALRAELRLNALELSDLNLRRGAAWALRTPTKLLTAYLAKLSVAPQRSLAASTLQGLPTQAQMAYLTWRSGVNLQSAISNATFHRYRRALLPHGVDISLDPPEEAWRGIDFQCLFAMGPKPPPVWAHGSPILACVN